MRFVRGLGSLLLWGKTDDEAQGRLKAIAGRAGIPSEAILATYAGVAGTPDVVAAGVQKIIDAGFCLITFIGAYADEEDIRLLSDEVIPQLKPCRAKPGDCVR